MAILQTLFLVLLFGVAQCHPGHDHDHEDHDHSQEERDIFEPTVPQSRVISVDGESLALRAKRSKANDLLLQAGKEGEPTWTEEKLYKLLSEGGASLYARDAENGFTVLHWFANAGYNIKNFPLWRLVLNHPLGRELIKAVDDEGATPLHRAAINNCLAIAEYLLEHGADIEAVDKHGFRPLHYAVRFARLETGKMLIEKGADVNALVEEGKPQTSPLQMARGFAKEGEASKQFLLPLMKLLKKKGAK
jgi:ankyrin repeat protein